MAFKPTKGRTVFVKPTGTANLSGFRAYANSLGQLSDVTNKMALSSARNEYNDMILQAEREGRTAGVKYVKDDQGNTVLAPLVDTSYASAAKIANVNDRKAIEERFRKTAVDTYASQLALDAGAEADLAFTKTPQDPNAIDASFEGFVEGLRQDLDPDTLSAVLPRVAAEFRTRVGKANAARHEQIRQDQIDTNLQSIQNLYDRQAVIAVVGASNDPEDQQGINDMINDINTSLTTNFEALKTNGYTDSQIDSIRRNGQIRVLTEGANATAEKLYYLSEEEGGGHANALAFALQTKREFILNQPPGMNLTQDEINIMTDSAVAHINDLHKIATATQVAGEKSQKVLVDAAKLDIATGGSLTSKDIFAMPIDDDQKVILLNALTTYQSGVVKSRRDAESDAQKVTDDVFDRRLAIYKDETQDASTRARAAAKLTAMEFEVSGSKFSQFQSARSDYHVKQIKQDNDVAISQYKYLMSDSGNFALTPEQITTQIPSLVKRGIIGEGPTADMSISAFEGLVETYRGKYDKHQAKQKRIKSALSNARLGILPSSTDKKDILEVFDVKLDADEEGRTLFHNDPQIADDNMEKAIEFSLAHKFIHPQLVDVLNGINNAAATDDEDLYARSIQIYNRVYQTISNGKNNAGQAGLGVGDLMAEKILNDSGVNTVHYSFARFMSAKEYAGMRANSEKLTSGTRVSNSLESTLGTDISQAIADNIGEAIEGSTFLETIGNNTFWDSERDKRALGILDQLYDSVPDGRSIDPSELIVRDPRLSAYLDSAVRSNMIQYKLPQDQKGLQLAIRKAIVDVSDSIGFNFDEDDNAYIGFNTWYKKAAASIGPAASTMPGGVSGGFFREVKRMVLRPDVAIDDKTKQLIESGEGTLVVEPSEVFGREQSYDIYVRDAEGINTQVLNNFVYDYKKSLDYAVMVTAVERSKNTTLRRFFSNVSLLRPGIIEDIKLDILADYNNNANLIGIMEPEMFIGTMEKLNAAINRVKPVAGFLTGNAYNIDPAPDAQDVKLLRMFLNGDFENEDRFIEKLQEIEYE